MTDEQIIKGLECCADESVEICNECPYFVDTFTCEQMQLRKDALDLISRQKAEVENQSQNFKVLVSDHRTLQQSFDNLKDLYEAEKAKVEKAKEKCIGFAKELQKTKSELKETTEKFNCQQYVYADLSDIIREKNAEIERLQSDYSSMQSTLAKMSMGVAEARAEAIKELMFNLDNEISTYSSAGKDLNVYAWLKNYAKEKVGE